MESTIVIDELVEALDPVVQKSTPLIQDERKFLGLPYPEQIKVVFEVTSDPSFARYDRDQDSIRLNLGRFIAEEYGFSEEFVSSATRLMQFGTYVSTLLDRLVTLPEIGQLLVDPAELQELSFNNMDSGQQLYRGSIRDICLESIQVMQDDINLVAPEFKRFVESGRFDSILLNYLRHETEHLSSSYHEERDQLAVEYRKFIADSNFSSEPDLHNLNWEGFRDLSKKTFELGLESYAREEARAYMFTFVPYMEWKQESIEVAVRKSRTYIDSNYNPSIFVEQALSYYVAEENASRLKLGNTNMIVPGGQEVSYILNKVSSPNSMVSPRTIPENMDMDFVSRVLYEKLPHDQAKYSKIVNDALNTNKTHLIGIIAK